MVDSRSRLVSACAIFGASNCDIYNYVYIYIYIYIQNALSDQRVQNKSTAVRYYYEIEKAVICLLQYALLYEGARIHYVIRIRRYVPSHEPCYLSPSSSLLPMFKFLPLLSEHRHNTLLRPLIKPAALLTPVLDPLMHQV
jgi:hypothetical protein